MKNKTKVKVIEGEIFLPKGKTITKGRLVIVDGIIKEVENRDRIDLGKYEKPEFSLSIDTYNNEEKILPGFVEPHCHLGIYEEITGEDRLNNKDKIIALDYRAIDNINFKNIGFQEALFNGGVTTCAVFPGSSCLIGGIGAIVKTATEEVIKSEYGLKISLGSNVEKEFNINRDSLESKLMETFKRDDNIYINRVLKRKMPVRFHCHLKEDIDIAINLKKKYNIDLIIEHGTESFKVLDELKRENIPVVTGPFFVGRPKKEMENLDRGLLKKLLLKGIRTSMMTDYPCNPPEMLKYTLLEAVKNGVEEWEALDLITILSSEILGIDNRVGSLEKGKDGDVVIHSHSPFNIRDNILKVYIKGEEIVE